MHNFIKPEKKIEDSLKLVGKGLRSPKKEFFASEKGTLTTLYEDYDVKAGRDELHLLSKHWRTVPADDVKTKVEKENKRHLANQLYGSNRQFLNDHWEYLKEKNNGETLFCPICGLGECEEMDHFVPKDETEFPEYSAHLSNLIPLCHNCNHKKSSKFLDDTGKRIFFNAFFDVLTDRNILVCDITVSSKDGLPQIKTKCNPSLLPTRTPDKYVLTTIADLELLARFDTKAKQWLRYEMNRLEQRAGQDWNVIIAEMKPLAKLMDNNPDIVYPSVLDAIVNSPIMENWFKAL